MNLCMVTRERQQNKEEKRERQESDENEVNKWLPAPCRFFP
jgi:hypothetical protein